VRCGVSEVTSSGEVEGRRRGLKEERLRGLRDLACGKGGNGGDYRQGKEVWELAGHREGASLSRTALGGHLREATIEIVVSAIRRAIRKGKKRGKRSHNRPGLGGERLPSRGGGLGHRKRGWGETMPCPAFRSRERKQGDKVGRGRGKNSFSRRKAKIQHGRSQQRSCVSGGKR